MVKKPSPPPQVPKFPDDLALEQFPGDIDRAHRLVLALQDLRHALSRAEGDHNLSSSEIRAVIKALLPFRPDGANAVDLPNKAPALWSERDLNLRENAPQFIRRVYGDWLGRGLARKDLSRLDEHLYGALSVWLTRHPDDEIVRLLPSQGEQIDELIERLSAEYPVEFLRKLGYAIDSRMRRQATSSRSS